MKAFSSSIRRQLLSWLLLPIIGLWIVDGTATFFVSMELANRAYDRSLADSVRTVATQFHVRQGQLVVDLPPEAEAILRQDNNDILYFQLIGPDGRLLCGDSVIPFPRHMKPDKMPRFRNARIGGRDVRISAEFIPVPDGSGRKALVQVAETLLQRTELANTILISVVLPQFLLIAFAALAVYMGVSRGLEPLTVVRDAVAKRSQFDLGPLSEDDAPLEVRPLVRAINALLARLAQDIDAQRRFVANAAHQLRTPLAGLKTQTQLALRRVNPSDLQADMQQIHTSADRCARLVNQLLALARVEPGAMDARPIDKQDLAATARAATEELVPHALRKGIDLGFESPPDNIFVDGDSVSLHELTFNLIENAVRYTQPGGKVTVRVCDGETVDLLVEDNGPGIPMDERELVFERFYRVLGNKATGSGLGLAIVREIVQSHKAQIFINDGPSGVGTAVLVRFQAPLSSVNAPAKAIKGNVGVQPTDSASAAQDLSKATS